MIVALFLIGIGVVAFVWSCVLDRRVHDALIDTLPLELRDLHTSRFAVPATALSPSTPLPVQADYVKSQIGICIAFLSAALCALFFDVVVLGWGLAAIFIGSVVVTIKSWKAYRANCSRKIVGDEEGQ